METNRFNQIDDYLQERLTNKEAKEFEEEVLHDKELSRQVQLCREIKEAILEEDVAGLRQKLSKIGKEKTKNRHRTLLLNMAAALAILVVTSVIVWKSYNSPDQLFNNYYTRYQPSGVGRSAATNRTLLQERIIELYTHGKLKDVTPILEKYTAEHTNETAAKLMLASAYIENNSPKKAENLLINTLNENQTEIYTETAQWYLCLAYLRQKKYKEALIVSSKITAYGGKYSKDAEVISKKLTDYVK